MTSGVLEGNTTAGSGKANDIYISRDVPTVQLVRPSQMDIDDAESLAWRDAINDTITKEGISGQRNVDRYLTLVNEKVISDGVYVDGVNGSDSADGTLEHPVKTPERVKELLGMLSPDAGSYRMPQKIRQILIHNIELNYISQILETEAILGLYFLHFFVLFLNLQN